MSDAVEDLEVKADWRTLGKMGRGPAWGRWNHQYRAFEFLEAYATHAYSTIPPEKPRAAVLRMPTGTGKTGVIALATAYGPLRGSTLVVVPSSALVTQFASEVAARYWLALGARPPTLPTAVTFTPSDLHRALGHAGAAGPSFVYVCTTQTLALCSGDTLSRDANRDQWKRGYAELLKRVGFVVIDEGHREPAPVWAKAIRRFKCPSVLITATPYRNDVRLFDVGPPEPDPVPHRFVFTFPDAVRVNCIRDVTFVAAKSSWKAVRRNQERAALFVRELLTFYREHVATRPRGQHGCPKVIVRCGSRGMVNEIRTCLRERVGQRKVVSIHDDFTGNDGDALTFHDVPPRSNAACREAPFWLHEDKLSEGIDNSSVWAVAFETPFGNSRALVQQVGRITRRTPRDEGRAAVVLFDPEDDALSRWKSYLSYEVMEPPIVGAPEIIERFIEALPTWFYYDGRYRPKVDLLADDTKSLISDLRVRASASIFRLTRSLKESELDELAEDVSDELQQRDTIAIRRPISVPYAGAVLRVLLTLRVSETPRFSTTNFLDVSFTPIMFLTNDRFFFFQGPIGIRSIAERFGLRPIEQPLLERALGATATVEQLSMTNTDLSDYAVRRRALAARNVASSGTSLADHTHYVVSAVARGDKHAGYNKRSVGLLRARVTDHLSRLIPVEQFVEWSEDITKRLLRKAAGPPLLRRFAEEVEAPVDAVPKFVLIDLSELRENLREPDDDEPPFDGDFQSVAGSVASDGTFSVRLEEQDYQGALRYEKGRFRLISKALDALLLKPHEHRKPTTIMASGRSLRVVTDEGLIYLDSKFVRPRSLWGPERAVDLDFIHGIDELAKISKNEKGQVPRKRKKDPFDFELNRRKSSWVDGCVFALLDDKKSSIYQAAEFAPEWILCDDDGQETADFIAIDSKNGRVAVIHCKAGRGRAADEAVSGTALHDVVSQAVKNLSLFDQATKVPARERRWRGQWMRRLPRMRAHPGMYKNPDKAAEAFQKALRERLRSTETRRELWLVLGNAISARGARLASASAEPKPHQVQFLYLLHSLQANAYAFGAGVRVFTSP